jgi:hypothetical protein
MSFIYVNQDVTITGEASSKSEEVEISEFQRERYREQERTPPKNITNVEALNISLKAGWNGVCISTRGTPAGMSPDLDRITDISIRITSPVGYKWVLR